MRIRGRRRCTECDQHWSYYETGSVTCPNCGSMQSVSAEDEGTFHTAMPTTLDLVDARMLIDEAPLREVAAEAETAVRTYLHERGFVDAGTLLPLDDAYLAAAELRYVADAIRRGLDPDEHEERYFLALLGDASEGNRPPTDAIPDSLRAARGTATVDAVENYRGDVSAWLDDRDRSDPAVRSALEVLRDHEKRIGALDGDVPATEADRLAHAAREIGTYLREDDEGALVRAEEYLSGMG